MSKSTRKVRLHGATVELRKYVLPGRYRITLSDERFGQVVREGRTWKATIRSCDSGAVVRHAGVWSSLREAVAEIMDIQHGLTAPVMMRYASRSYHVDIGRDG